MKLLELEDRINRVINTDAFLAVLKEHKLHHFDFQLTWYGLSRGDFDKLPPIFQQAILAGENDPRESWKLN